MSNSEAIAKIDQRLLELEKERQYLLEKKQYLLSSSQPFLAVHEQFSTADKIQIFQSLFRGREDVIAARWQSNSSGRSGYSPACHNEWRPGICQKPRIKCTDCPHQNFEHYTGTAIHGHLTGKRTLGVYPLLPQDSCWFLAVDFDKKSWKQEVTAFVQACSTHDIACHREISRSGNGAHIWIFFSSPVAAMEARQMGSFLLDQAMESCPELSFDSYDRFFPNQDTMPKGGFGNLIALPLQYQPRQQGYSVFVDEQFIAYPDQWQYLSQVDKVTPGEVAELATQYRLQFGKGVAPEIELAPWEAGLPQSTNKIDDCPKQLNIVLANELYVPMKSLPAKLLARMKKLASFPNPVFFKTQAMRFSTQGIPRIISCCRIEEGYLRLPRGCLDDLSTLLEAQDCELVIEDKRTTGTEVKDLAFQGTLKKEQQKAVTVMQKSSVGVLHAPTAFGKTVTALALVAERKVNTLVLVHSRQLIDQWKERAVAFLNVEKIGTIAGGRKKPSGIFDIATYQSLISRGDNKINPLVYDYGHIIIDECHHLSAPRYELLVNEVRSRYVLGITATPYRQDGHQAIIHMQAGPVRYKAKEKRSDYVRRVFFKDSGLTLPTEWLERKPHISEVYQWLARHEERNQIIVQDALNAVGAGRYPIILTERKEHAICLHQLLSDQIPSTEVLHGGMREKTRKEVLQRITDSSSPSPLIATGKYLGEGFDLPKLDTLFLALPVSWKGTLAQYAGRIHREHQGKTEVLIYDYTDSAIPMLARMKQRREKGYQHLGYVIDSGCEFLI